MKVSYLSLASDNNYELLSEAFREVLESGVYLFGSQLDDFEVQFSQFCGVVYSAGVGTGYDALYLSLKSLDLKPGDKIIIPAHTFVASWHAAANAGLQIVPIDADIHSFNLQVDNLEASFNSSVKAIMPVHMYGQTCSMDKIVDFCKRNQVKCIEDFAQSHGASYKGKRAGSMGDIGATSFYPVKNLGALGDGGAITTNSQTLIQKAKMFRNYGSEQKYYYNEIGINSRLGELQAAFLNVKLKLLDNANKVRREIAQRYINELDGIGDLILPLESEDCFHVYHLFVIKTKERNNLKEFLEKKEIETLIHYPIPPHLQKAYKFMGFKKGDFPVAERIASDALSLPCYPGLPATHQEYVIESIRSFFNGN
jgi:dTDP-4-amino-4,6-dideoxygalactose transaminase